MTITTRAGKGSALTHNEMDTNFTDLRDGVGGRIWQKTQNAGDLIDPSSPDFGWIDIHAPLYFNSSGTPAVFSSYRGGISQWQFTETTADEAFCEFHIPHDYAMGTDIFFHVHWSHASTTVTGGSVTWAFEMSYSKGHDQAIFAAPKTVTIQQNASTTQYQHMIAEAAGTVSGGSGTQFDSAIMEPDGVFICRFYLDSNDITDSVTQPNPFVHFVDLHMQSTGIATKNKSPDFWT